MRALALALVLVLAPSIGWGQSLPGASGASSSGNGATEAGTVKLKLSGTCGSGWSELAGINGKMLRGTIAANNNVGTTGGSDTITPAGIISGAAVADHASHTHTYTDVPNHVHGFTDLRGLATGTTSTPRGITETVDASSTVTTLKTANPDGGVASGTTSGPSATLSHSVTQGTFTGTQFDNRPAYVNVIVCVKD